jgi:hypothetical protein
VPFCKKGVRVFEDHCQGGEAASVFRNATFREVDTIALVMWFATVLVQGEMERGHSPLVSIARALAPSLAAERNGNWHEEAGDGNCNWFKRRSGSVLSADAKIVGFPPGGRLG